jgi:hypothetical protein
MKFGIKSQPFSRLQHTPFIYQLFLWHRFFTHLLLRFSPRMPSNTVPLVELGKNGPKVPHLGYGLMGLSYETYGTVPSDEERFKILDRAHELGSTFWDSAEYVSSLLWHKTTSY